MDCYSSDYHIRFLASSTKLDDKSNIGLPLQRLDQVAIGKKKPKTNFVEMRTFWHLYRSFDRMWVFFILAFQVLLTKDCYFLH